MKFSMAHLIIFSFNRFLSKTLLVSASSVALGASLISTPAWAASVGTGKATGLFDNATLESNGASFYKGNGTNNIAWGNNTSFTPFPNRFTFNSKNFSDQPKGTTFVIGNLNYTNGTVGTNTGIKSVDLILNTTSNDPDFVHTLRVPITIVNTPNKVNDPLGSADYIYFTERPELGSFRVLEGNGTSVEVLTQFNSLDLIGFGRVANPSVGFVAPWTPTPIPTPALLPGLIGLSLSVLKKRKCVNA